MKEAWPPGLEGSGGSCSSGPAVGGGSVSTGGRLPSETLQVLTAGVTAGPAAGPGMSAMAGQVQSPPQALPIIRHSNLLPANAPEPPLLFNGLRVRMGMSSGVLPSGTTVQGSDVLNRAKEVSDAGAGGQVGKGRG